MADELLRRGGLYPAMNACGLLNMMSMGAAT